MGSNQDLRELLYKTTKIVNKYFAWNVVFCRDLEIERYILYSPGVLPFITDASGLKINIMSLIRLYYLAANFLTH